MNRAQRRLYRSKNKIKKEPTLDLRRHTLGKLKAFGVSKPNCYANSLNSCDGKMSREHFISETILQQIEFISTKGIPWLAHKEGNVPINDLVSKCLCSYHNSFLSELDTLAGKLFQELRQFHEPAMKRIVVPGYSFQRFMLKILFGLLSTGQFPHNGRKYNVQDLEPFWVKVLYGEAEFPDGTGMFVYYQGGEKIQIENRITAAPVFLGDRVCGLELQMCGFTFLLSLEPKHIAFKQNHPGYDFILDKLRVLQSDSSLKKIQFNW